MDANAATRRCPVCGHVGCGFHALRVTTPCSSCLLVPERGGRCDGCGATWRPDEHGTLQRTAAFGDEFLRGQRVMRESGAPPLGVDYWYRCGACGSISPANRWPAQDDTLSCPVCKFVHSDSDDDPGVEDGTFEELHGR